VPTLPELRQQAENCSDPARKLHLQAALALAESKPGRALELVQRSLELEVNLSARNTLAVCLLHCGQREQAAALLTELVREQPEQADLWYNLARAQPNVEALEQVERLRPGWLPARLLLARTLEREAGLRLLRQLEQPEARLLEARLLLEGDRPGEAVELLLEHWPTCPQLLVQALHTLGSLPRHPALPQCLIECRQVAGALDLFPAALRLWPDHQQLLVTLLRHGQVCDLELEQRLAAWRRHSRVPGELAEALAMHNLAHEFAMLEEPGEAAGLSPEDPAYALYRGEPEATVSDQSDPVRRQYEENPYPRWRELGQTQGPRPFHELLGAEVIDQPRILVAGCGTGRHALMTARRFTGARVWGVDLSENSLAYAHRQAGREVTFLRGDLLALDQLDLPHQFDLIESVGVLHHLENPLQGLLALCRRLRPGGWMRLGLYSARARRGLGPAKALARRLAPTLDLRQLRYQLVKQLAPNDLKALTGFRDFYSLSGLRDLLLHPREVEYDLAGVGQLLASAGLQLVNFDGPPVQFGGDLEAWQRYEEENPDTFRGMYVFWCRASQA